MVAEKIAGWLLGWLPGNLAQHTLESLALSGYRGFLLSIDNQSNQERKEKRKQVTRGRTDIHTTENSVLALVAGVGCRTTLGSLPLSGIAIRALRQG